MALIYVLFERCLHCRRDDRALQILHLAARTGRLHRSLRCCHLGACIQDCFSRGFIVLCPHAAGGGTTQRQMRVLPNPLAIAEASSLLRAPWLAKACMQGSSGHCHYSSQLARLRTSLACMTCAAHAQAFHIMNVLWTRKSLIWELVASTSCTPLVLTYSGSTAVFALGQQSLPLARHQTTCDCRSRLVCEILLQNMEVIISIDNAR